MHGPRRGFCHFATFVNYTLSSYPDESWYKPAFDAAYRKKLLDYSFAHWKIHPPYLKGQLALTLKRMGRPADAKLVWDSVMDSAKTDRDLGTSWAPEDRSWLWYNDTIETHAFALRTLMELEPADARRHGLVQWLFLNKKLNQWKSTRATAEVIYSLAYYLKKEGALGDPRGRDRDRGRAEDDVRLRAGPLHGQEEPGRRAGRQARPEDGRDGRRREGRQGPRLRLGDLALLDGEAARGGPRRLLRRLAPLLQTRGAAGVCAQAARRGGRRRPGDEIEVQISLRAKHAAEYVHLRDPRAAGMEPENAVSRYKWDLGISWYEETRDSGANFFFEPLPAGEYTFKYRLRANMAGTFRWARRRCSRCTRRSSPRTRRATRSRSRPLIC